MSRARDTAVNMLLGILLVVVFLLPFLLAVAVGGYVLQALDRGVRYFLPGIANSSTFTFFSLLCLWSLVYGVAHLRKRRWQNAFLSFAILPIIVSIWFSDVHSVLGLNGLFWMWPLFLMLTIPTDSRLTRAEFLGGASIVAAAVAVNAGLLGSGSLARVAADSVFMGLLVGFVIHVCQSWSSPKSPDPHAPLSPTGA